MLKVLPCVMSCFITVRVWCPQSVRCLPLCSVMVVARSAGWASHTISGCLLVGFVPRPAVHVLAGVCVRAPLTMVVVLCRTGLNKNSPDQNGRAWN